MKEHLWGKIATLPEKPGVWLRKGAGVWELYLGKANSGLIFGHPRNCMYPGRFENRPDLQIREGIPKVPPKSAPEMAKGLGRQT